MQVKFFYWKLAWMKLPCKSVLAGIGILPSQSATCDLWPDLLEDMAHKFLCSSAGSSLLATLINVFKTLPA